MNETKTNLTLLRERVEQNYEDYKEEQSWSDTDFYFIFSKEIAAVEEVKNKIDDVDYISESDAAFLLSFDNPLKTLADEWQSHSRQNGSDDFEGFLSLFIFRHGGEDTVHGLIGELSEKYGKYTPLNTACLLELVEINRRLLREYIGFEMEEDENSEGGDV